MTFITARDAKEIEAGTYGELFGLLGPHQYDGKPIIAAYVPGANGIEVVDFKNSNIIASLSPIGDTTGLFVGYLNKADEDLAYRLQISQAGEVRLIDDPYRFGPVIGELDEHLISEGVHHRLWEILGANIITHEGVSGTHFALWAPNARRISVVGGFNGWDGRCHGMRRCGQTGVWEIFIPAIGEGEAYKYEMLDGAGNLLPQKADPFGFGSEHPPQNASIIRRITGYEWSDQKWMNKRGALQKFDQPISIYEVHLGSWKRVQDEGNRPLSYLEYASQLVEYVKTLGFSHIELMPISEFPFDGSWGYQPIGLFAPTIRHGTLQEFRAFVEACHEAQIGILLDWVPGHFPEDAHGLGQFDGTPLYEHADRREGFHPDWNTLVFNLGRREVVNYLASNALYWLQEHHADGLRVDAVASMLYRDYSRKQGEWLPNKDGGRENLEAIDFLRHVNETVYGKIPGIVTMAEESTAFRGVSTPTSDGGLGFGFKWNMGWMNDTLSYMKEDPIHRKYHHEKMTFGLHYAFSENFVLPLSHDEVVHGKGSLIGKMPGQKHDQFANLRAYYGFMWGHPGKKLLFMGGEFAQLGEWNHDGELDWHLLDEKYSDYELHRGMQLLVRDLNAIYKSTPALYQLDVKNSGFEWVEEHSGEDSVFVWLRYGHDKTKPVLVASNMTPIERSNRRIGVPIAGKWLEKINTDAEIYGGGGSGNLGVVFSEEIAANGRPNSLNLTLPALSTLMFEFEGM